MRHKGHSIRLILIEIRRSGVRFCSGEFSLMRLIQADGIPGDTRVAWSPEEGKALGKLSKNRWGGAGPAPIEDGRYRLAAWAGASVD